MHCTLLIPRLFWPRPAADDVCRGLAADELELMLGRAHREAYEPVSAEGWLCRAFEVERQRDWPVAPLTLELDGGDAGDARWLRADPVHVDVHRDRLMLADASAFALDAAEADALVAGLNAHFAADGLRFEARSPTRWHLRVATHHDIATVELSEVAGGDASARLPKGADALHWHRLWNEMQMVLHAHPVNAAREARGERAINSVWLWGGGSRPDVPGRHFDAVWSDDALAHALAVRADCAVAPVPTGAAQWLDAARSAARHLVVIDRPAAGVRYGDAARWRGDIAALNRDWFAPLLAALRARRLAKLVVVVPDDAACRRFEVAPLDLLKFWRGTRPLAACG